MTPAERIAYLEKTWSLTHGDQNWLMAVAKAAVAWRDCWSQRTIPDHRGVRADAAQEATRALIAAVDGAE